MKRIIKNSVTSSKSTNPQSEYEYRKHIYLKRKHEFETLGEDDNNDVLSREEKMNIAKAEMDKVNPKSVKSAKDATFKNDKRLSTTSERYKGYLIVLDRGGDGYNVYDKHRELEDAGYPSKEAAKNFIDELVANDDVYSADAVDDIESEFQRIDRSGTDEEVAIAAIMYNLGTTMREAREILPTLSEDKIKDYVDYYYLRDLPRSKRIEIWNNRKNISSSSNVKASNDDYNPYSFMVGDQLEWSGLYGGQYKGVVTNVNDEYVTVEVMWTAEDSGDTIIDTQQFEIATDPEGRECIIVWTYGSDAGYVYPPSNDYINSAYEYDVSDWRELASKSVEDSDGFNTDYTLYTNGETYICMFGDKDLYEPDEAYADYETENEQDAWDWFNSYTGFADEEDEYDIYGSEDLESDFNEYEDDIQEISQEFTSENTSINSTKLPAIFKMVSFEPGTTNIDYGGGRFDNVADYLTQYDVINLVYDPYNRTPEHNKEVIKTLRRAGGADTATCSNVLNVIKEPEVRKNVLENISKIVKPGGKVYITVYEGSGKGDEGPTKAGYQLNRRTAEYLDEIREVFPDATRKGKLIFATNSRAVNSSSSIKSSSEIIWDDLDWNQQIQVMKRYIRNYKGTRIFEDFADYINKPVEDIIDSFCDAESYGDIRIPERKQIDSEYRNDDIYSSTTLSDRYWYFTRHGVQPGSVPKYVNILDIVDTPEGTYFLADGVILTNDLRNYEIQERKPKGEIYSSKQSNSKLNQIRDKITKVVKNVMMLEAGFSEDEVEEYSVVEVDPSGKVEVRAEVDYDGLMSLCDALNPIVQRYDKDSYFEPVQPGIIQAYIENKNDVVESSKSPNSVANKYPEYMKVSRGGQDFSVHYNLIDNSPSADAHQMWLGFQASVSAIKPYDDAEYAWAQIENGHINVIKGGKVIQQYYYFDADDMDVENSEWCDAIIEQAIDYISEINDKVESRMVHNSTSTKGETIEAGYYDVPERPLDPPEYDDPVEEDPIQEICEFSFDVVVILDKDGGWDYENNDYSFAANPDDKQGDWYTYEDHIYLTDQTGMVEDLDDLIEPMMPAGPGKYRIQGDATMVFDVDNLYAYYDYYRDGSYDKELLKDDAEVTFNYQESKVENFKFIELN